MNTFPITDTLKLKKEIIFLTELYSIRSTGLIRLSRCSARDLYAQNSCYIQRQACQCDRQCMIANVSAAILKLLVVNDSSFPSVDLW